MNKPLEDLHIVKLKLENLSEKELKKKLKINNAEIDYISKKEKYESFFRFTFESTFEYLDKEEVLTKEIIIHDNKIINLDLFKDSIEKGNKKEIKIPDTRESYFIAKEELKKLNAEKKKEVLDRLEKNIEIEKQKIEKKFSKYSSKYIEDLKKLNETLYEFEKEGEFENAERQKELIQELREKYRIKGLEENKERAFQIEEQKHMLNINTKLVKTTLIYYPIFLFVIYYKNTLSEKRIEISLDVLKKDSLNLSCEVCKKENGDMYLGAKGHICCEKCAVNCQVCHKIYCKKCVENECKICHKNICKECATRCYRCGRLVCKTHVKEDRVSKRIYCTDCLKRCERCGKLKDPYSFKISKKTNANICEECFRDEMQEKVLKRVFD
ncbi:MAG: hypothetical protein U9Q99_02455 [Nanoarchaeota archaeon]|nr:hypothetical protein [Nanoarchaeota archaeon]